MPDLPPVEQSWSADTTAYVGGLEAAIAAAKQFDQANRDAIGSVAALQAAIDALHGNDVHINVDEQGLNAVHDILGTFAETDRVARDADQAMADYAATLSRVADEWERTSNEARAGDQVIGDAGAAATQALLDQTRALGAAGDAARNSTHSMTLWGTAVRALTADIPLFGGALDKIPLLATVAGWHMLADAIVETVAVWVPATIAFAAFGAAAAPTAMNIYTQMKNLYTVSQATGQAIPGLTGNFGRLAQAVRPEVYQLFGEALDTATHSGNAFSTMALGAGHVLDQLGARMEVAITDGHGMSGFAQSAVSDLSRLGDSIGNVVGILGNFLKVVPGYAHVLLGLGDGATHVAEVFTAMAEPVLRAGLAFHGAAIYLGLAGTLVASSLRGGITMIGNWAEKAGMAILSTDAFGAAGEKAGSALLGFSGAAADAAALPWGWITIAAAGIGILAYKMLTAKDATQQWLAAQQQALQAASAVKGYTMLQEDQAQVADRLALAQEHYGITAAQAAKATADVGYGWQATAREMRGGATTMNDLTQGQKVLSDQSTLYGIRLGKLAAEYGGVGNAEGLLTSAGIKMSQMLDKSSEAWAQIQAQVAGLVAAYREMGQQGGTLGADMNALTIAGSNQVEAMGNLNKAWDTTIGIMSGGQNAFISFEQAMSSSATGSAKLNGSIGALDTAMKNTGATMSGLNPASLGLRSAWQGAYGAGEQLIDALRMMSSVSPGGFPSIGLAVKDVIAQLIPLGRQSAATRTELVQMAQEIDPGVTSFRDLTTWLGNTHNAARQLNGILAKSGTDLQDLSAAASKLSDAMQSDVTQQMAAAKLAANGTDHAITQLANAINTAGTTAATRHSDMVTLYDDLRKDGYSAQQAAAMVDQLTGSLFKVPGPADRASSALQRLDGWINSLHSKNITIGVQEVVSSQALHGIAAAGASGGYASGTDYARAGVALVGEHGPELVAFGGGERVYDSGETARMIAGMGTTPRGAASSGGGGLLPPVNVHVHLDGQLDGDSVWTAMQTRTSIYGTRNNGARTGTWAPAGAGR